MPFDFGEVILVPFPFTDQTASKRRPAAVVSNRAYSTARPDLIVMAITSQLRPSAGSAIGRPRDCSGPRWSNRCSPLFEQRLVLRRLGVLGADDQTALRKAIAEIIG